MPSVQSCLTYWSNDILEDMRFFSPLFSTMFSSILCSWLQEECSRFGWNIKIWKYAGKERDYLFPHSQRRLKTPYRTFAHHSFASIELYANECPWEWDCHIGWDKSFSKGRMLEIVWGRTNDSHTEGWPNEKISSRATKSWVKYEM